MALFSYMIGIVWLIIIPGADSFLSYDHQGQQLRFQCPQPGSVASPDKLIQAFLSRAPLHGGNTTLLADWHISSGLGKGKSLHDRVTVPDSSTDYLQATLEHVTCYDSANYKYECVTTVRSESINHTRHHQSFQFIGKIGPPYLSLAPLKSPYKEGELLTLHCNASVGTPDNGIVWEAGPPEGPFNPVTGEMNSTTGKPYEEEQVIHPDCSRESRFSLKYRVGAKDDGKVFQCRLRKTGQTTRVAIAALGDRERCASGLQNDVTDGKRDDLELAATLQASGQNHEQISGERGDNADVRGMATSSWLVIGAAILVTMAIVAVSVIVVFRRWKRNQLQPLIVIDCQACSPSETSIAGRRLPSLPDLNTTTPKRIAEAQPHNPDNSPQPCSLEASVYVSTNAIYSCDRDNNAQDARNAPALPEKDAQEVGNILPDMRIDRSESVYSNQSAIEEESCKSASVVVAAVVAASPAASHAAAPAVTGVSAAGAAVAASAGGDDAYLEELKLNDDSVFISTPFEMI